MCRRNLLCNQKMPMKPSFCDTGQIYCPAMVVPGDEIMFKRLSVDGGASGRQMPTISTRVVYGKGIESGHRDNVFIRTWEKTMAER